MPQYEVTILGTFECRVTVDGDDPIDAERNAVEVAREHQLGSLRKLNIQGYRRRRITTGENDD